MSSIISISKYKGKNINIKELAKVIVYFANNTRKTLYKTKANKLLFYTQFLFYKEYKKDLLGMTFICDYYGPTINELDDYLCILESKKIISINQNGYGKYINAKINLKKSAYTEKELYVLQKVATKFKNYSSSEISEYSHKEKLWKDALLKEVIPLEKAQELSEFYE